MRRFKKILVLSGNPDQTPRILDRAARLAARNDAVLTLLGVAEAMPERQPVVLDDGDRLDVEGLLAADKRRRLEALAAEVDGVDVVVDVRTGVPFLEVIDRVAHDGHDLVITAPDGAQRRGLAGASTTMHLLRKCPVPVWVDVEQEAHNPDVLVAVGPFDDEHASVGMNRTLLELGSSLAAMRGGTVHVAHAWRLVGESLLRRRRVGPSREQVDQMVEATRDGAALGLQSLLDSVPDAGAPVQTHLEKGQAGDVIPRLVEQLRPGVVVIGTLARTGLQGVIMGNTVERVLGVVDTPIMAVKPPGFVSPIGEVRR